MDMIHFEEQLVKDMRKKQQDQKQIKNDLCVAMKNLEDKNAVNKKNEAIMDELNKKGPPMMQEIELNQNKLTETKNQVNMIQGVENYKLMLNQRRAAQDNRFEELAEYKAKFSEDLMARLN